VIRFFETNKLKKIKKKGYIKLEKLVKNLKKSSEKKISVKYLKKLSKKFLSREVIVQLSAKFVSKIE